MARHAVRGLKWAVVPLALLGYAFYLALGLSSPPVEGPAGFGPDDAVWMLGQVLFAMVGAVIASRRPESPIGWLFGIAGLLGLVEGITARIAVHSLAAGPWSPVGGTAAWVSAALWYPNIALLVLGGLLFPSGRPPSRGWWAAAWLLGAGGAVAAAGIGLLWPARGLELLDSTPRSLSAPLGTAVMNAVDAVVLHRRFTGKAYNMVHGITITGITRPVEKTADWTYYHTLDFALTTSWDEFEDLLAQ